MGLEKHFRPGKLWWIYEVAQKLKTDEYIKSNKDFYHILTIFSKKTLYFYRSFVCLKRSYSPIGLFPF